MAEKDTKDRQWDWLWRCYNICSSKLFCHRLRYQVLLLLQREALIQTLFSFHDRGMQPWSSPVRVRICCHGCAGYINLTGPIWYTLRGTGREASVYPDSARLLHYRVHQRVKSVTTYITAVAERHTPLPWWSAIPPPPPPAVLSQTVVGGCRDTRGDKKDSVRGFSMFQSVCMWSECVYLTRRVSITARDTYVLPALFGPTICGLSCTHQERRATIAKVPAVMGAARRDKTGAMTCQRLHWT